MAPYNKGETGTLYEEEISNSHLVSEETVKFYKADDRKLKLVWRNVILMSLLHLSAIYGLYLACTSSQWRTNVLAYGIALTAGLGITAGAHRLWAHRSYKAKLPLKILLVIFNTISFQGPVIEWARDHRMHHKYTETDADPHNSQRGFFFSHVGWLLCRKHPEIFEKSKTVDFSDLYDDPVLVFQKKYYLYLMPVMCFIIPTMMPVYLFGETWKNSWFVAAMLRYAYSLNVTWLVNSAAHMFGNKPYDKHMKSVENLSVSALALGEGFHNYHHTFPWDYKVAELGGYSLNTTKAFIDLMAMIGWAYDLKSPTNDLIEKRIKRTGDGTHPRIH